MYLRSECKRIESEPRRRSHRTGLCPTSSTLLTLRRELRYCSHSCQSMRGTHVCQPQEVTEERDPASGQPHPAPHSSPSPIHPKASTGHESTGSHVRRGRSACSEVFSTWAAGTARASGRFQTGVTLLPPPPRPPASPPPPGNGNFHSGCIFIPPSQKEKEGTGHSVI